MNSKNDSKVLLNKQERGWIFASIVELGGLYNSRFAKHLLKTHVVSYNKLEKEILEYSQLEIKDIPFILDTLDLLINEMSDWDFGAIYPGESKREVKALYDKLEIIYSQHQTTTIAPSK